MQESAFDERIAPSYDTLVAHMFDPVVVEPAVNFLAKLCGEGSALEFAIGTGRVAIPLARSGVPVHGIDISPAMLDCLQRKPEAATIQVTLGDMAEAQVGQDFQLVYLVFNTITNLTSQARQVACFANAAAHLKVGGCFVVEVAVPDLRRLPPGETVRAFDVSPERLGFDEYTDFTRQVFRSHHYQVRPEKTEVFSTHHRFVWPSELDLMAQLAGLTFRERWSDWVGRPFSADSNAHVSVWEKRGPGEGMEKTGPKPPVGRSVDNV